MKKLYDGKCDNPSCEQSGECVEMWAEGVDESGALVDGECDVCRGRVMRVLSPIRFGRYGGGDGGRNLDDGCAGGDVELRLCAGEDGEMRMRAVLDGQHGENCAPMRSWLQRLTVVVRLLELVSWLPGAAIIKGILCTDKMAPHGFFAE